MKTYPLFVASLLAAAVGAVAQPAVGQQKEQAAAPAADAQQAAPAADAQQTSGEQGKSADKKAKKKSKQGDAGKKK